MQDPTAFLSHLWSGYSLELVMLPYFLPETPTFQRCGVLFTDGAVPLMSTFCSRQVVRAVVKDAGTDPHSAEDTIEWLSAFGWLKDQTKRSETQREDPHNAGSPEPCFHAKEFL